MSSPDIICISDDDEHTAKSKPEQQLATAFKPFYIDDETTNATKVGMRSSGPPEANTTDANVAYDFGPCPYCEDREYNCPLHGKADPALLCPYCDRFLPKQPSRTLKQLLVDAKLISVAAPRTTNSLGRKVHGGFVGRPAACSRHEFESALLPRAQKEGWPQTIDWENLGARITKLKGHLARIIAQRQERDSFYWKRLMKQVKTKGLNATLASLSQLEIFNGFGYYGEIGYMVVMHTLDDIFPEESIDFKDIEPLDGGSFKHFILGPEVIVCLVMDDLDLGGAADAYRKAVRIVKDSTSYGLIMFPDDETNAGTQVCDAIVKERAARKRKDRQSSDEREEQQPASKRLNCF
ncbi:hypothetical protein C8J56DRAFT_1050032 [Mycena floridula]|nr:hypothetical protein C8J56DRAFT_1050032 [Mycena floridula]